MFAALRPPPFHFSGQLTRQNNRHDSKISWWRNCEHTDLLLLVGQCSLTARFWGRTGDKIFLWGHFCEGVEGTVMREWWSKWGWLYRRKKSQAIRVRIVTATAWWSQQLGPQSLGCKTEQWQQLEWQSLGCRLGTERWRNANLSGTSINKKKKKTRRAAGTAYLWLQQLEPQSQRWTLKPKMQTWNRVVEKCHSVRH